jgi:O-antigen/teichoic acid export membrane protein
VVTYRNILRHSVTYSIPIVLAKMCSFFLLPVYTRCLTPADYGVLELLDLTSFVLSSLIGARLVDALFYFHADAQTPQTRNKIVTTAFLTAIFLGAAGAALGLSFSTNLSAAVFGTREYAPYFRLLFANFVLIFPQEIGLGYLRVLNRSTLFISFQIVRMILAIGLNLVLLLRFSLGIRALLWSSLGTSIVMAVMLAVVVFSKMKLGFSWSVCRGMVRYAIPASLSGLGMLLIHYGDRFFLERSATLTDVGLYSVAYKMGMLVSYVQVPFDAYWNSQMYGVVRSEGGERVYIRVCTYFTLMLTGVALTISVFSRPALALLTASEYHAAAVYIPAIAAAYVLRGLGDQFRNVFFLENRTGRDAKVGVVGVIVCLLGYFFLIPRFKAWGAIAATGGAFLVMTVFSYRQAQQTRQFGYEIKRLAKIGVSAGTSGLVCFLIPSRGITVDCLVGLGCLGLFVALLLLLKFPDHEETDKLQTLRSAIGRRLRAATALV